MKGALKLKVILVNGSPHEKGCTYTALKEVDKSLVENGIETEVMHIGKEPVSSCIACNRCAKTNRCFINDKVNVLLEKTATTDGFVFGTPVYFAAASGGLTSFMDRLFYSGKNMLEGKLGAAVVSCRRGGASATFDQINKYFTIRKMPIVSSMYWNSVHGNTPEEVMQDLEGLQTMRTLGNNMAWLLKCIEAGREKGITMVNNEEPIKTNFIR